MPSGGARNGAGRPPVDPRDPGKDRTVYIHESDWKKAKKLGKGNASAGIRAALRGIK